MKRGFLLYLGSLALALVHADLPSGYPGTAQGDPIQLQYLPGVGPPEDDGGRIRPLRVEGRARAKGPPLPNEFKGSLELSSVPGEAGVDYPTYSEVPVTSFTCQGKAAGYYADQETRCQTFHVCTSGGSTSNSFLCPNGTIFNTAVRTCDWWAAVDCGSSSDNLRLHQDIMRTTQKTNVEGSRSQRPNRRQPKGRGASPKEEGIASPRGSFHASQIRQTIHGTSRPYVSEKLENSLSKDVFERRPEEGSSNRRPETFLGALRKQKQKLRTTTQVVPHQSRFYAEASNLTVGSLKQPNLRTAPLRTTKLTQRPLTVTRFDFTSETLEFPSMRTTPSRSSLNRGKNFGTPDKQTARTATSNNEAPNQERKYTSSRNGRRRHKASRLVTPTTRQPFGVTRPQLVTKHHPAVTPFSEDSDHFSSPRKYIQSTQYIPIRVTSPGTEQDNLPNSERMRLNYPVTTEAALMEETIRPFVVISPDKMSNSYSKPDDNTFSQFNDKHFNKEFNPNEKESHFVFSQANAMSVSEERVSSTRIFPYNTSPSRAEEPFSSVTSSPQVFPNNPNTNNVQNGFGLGLTDTLSSTQSGIIIPQQKSSERTNYNTVDYSKSLTTQQSTSLGSFQKTAEHEDSGIIPSRTGAFHITHSPSDETRQADVNNPRTKENSNYSTKSYAYYNPTTSSTTETARSNTRNNPTTIDGSPTKPTASSQSQKNNDSLFTGTTQSLVPSKKDSNELVDEKEEFIPPPSHSGHSFSSAKAISGSFNFNNNLGSYPYAFANSLANKFLSNAEFNTQTTQSPIPFSSLSRGSSNFNEVPLPTVTEATFPGPTDYKRRSRPSLSNSVNSFTSSNALVSNEVFSQPSIASYTPSSTAPTPSSPTSSTLKSLKPIPTLPSITFKATSTTTKLLYSPTVPQTTVTRPITTTTSLSDLTEITPSPKTTDVVPRASANIPKTPFFEPQNILNVTFSTTTRQSTTFNPTTSTTPSTTKKIKGFFITHPPPIRSTSPKATNDKDPKNTYFPQLSLSVPNSTSTYLYKPPIPQIQDFYYKPTPPTTKFTYSSVDSVKSVSHTLDSSNFNLRPQLQTDNRQPQYSGIYGPPSSSAPPENEPTIKMKHLEGSSTTEPSFVIQKSVELFATHEVAFHPSVLAKSAYSPLSFQNDHKVGEDNIQALVPPPILVPSPKARGFEKWNTEDHTDKLTHPRAF